jgi:hypothetical protein
MLGRRKYMTTIVNSPAPANDGGSSSGLLIGFFMVIVLGLIFFYFGLPAIRRMGSATPQINVPNQIDVNVKQTP